MNPIVRERATTAHEFDPAEVHRGSRTDTPPSIVAAALPLIVVVGVNFLMSLVVLPRMDVSFLAEPRWGETSLSAAGGVWAVIVALAAAILTLLVVNGRRLPALRASMDSGANASVLPALSVASLVGFGAVVAAMPAFGMVRDRCFPSAAPAGANASVLPLEAAGLVEVERLPGQSARIGLAPEWRKTCPDGTVIRLAEVLERAE